MDIDTDDDERFTVAFTGWEGPIDALLELARAQKVDLALIDIVAVVDRFEAVLARALALRIEVAGDWLVAAAWLAYLKSRALLRRPKADREEGEPDEDALAYHLRRLDAVRRAADDLAARRQVGRDWFAPGAAAEATDGPAGRIGVSLHGLLEAYARIGADRADPPPAVPDLKPFDLCSVDAALGALGTMLAGKGWTDLLSLLPVADGELRARSDVASHVVAALELARVGSLDVEQFAPSAAVMVRERSDAR